MFHHNMHEHVSVIHVPEEYISYKFLPWRTIAKQIKSNG